MEPRDLPELSRFNPADWEFRVRRSDGFWLARPATSPDAAANGRTWTRRIPDGWSFDSVAEARAAAAAHGAAPETVAVIPAPRRPGEWLAKSGAA